MTIVEFYDKTPLENIASGLLCSPDKIILVGDDKRPLEKAVRFFSEILKRRGINAEIVYKVANKNNLNNIVKILSEIIDENEGCTFDLTGGEDLYLVALGIVMARYGDKVSCHRVNFNNDSLIDCDADGKLLSTGEFDISVEETVTVHGGSIVTDPRVPLHTYPWVFDAEFIKDVKDLWKLCSESGNAWNSHLVGTLKRLSDISSSLADLTLKFNQTQALAAVNFQAKKLSEFNNFLYSLSSLGLIDLTVISDEYEVIFKNDRIKRCLTVEGQVLELCVAATLLNCKQSDDRQLYHDVRVGVVIDWDFPDDPDTYRTVNEIDVLAVKGMIPIFISCKNGNFDVDEFYKLSTVADYFGVKYAKKALVCHNLAGQLGEAKAAHFKARAEDMGIRIIDITKNLSDDDVERKLRSLWSNS